MEKITFITLAVNPFWIDQTILLAQSLRAFGCSLAEAPIKVLNPAGTKPLPEDIKDKISSLQIEIIPIEIEESALKFPLGFLPFAAAEGEKLTFGTSEQMAWVLPDTLIVSGLDSLTLNPGKQLAYRPVHHSNIGSEFGQELDPYWTQVYRHCEVPNERVFPMTTCTRDKVLRPYINAGMLVVRPENGFMRAWMESFRSAYRSAEFLPLVEDQRSAIFLHQAILSGILLNRFTQSDLQELPEAVNYPLHLHHEYPPEHRPKRLNDLITCRYESLKELQACMDQIGVEEPLFSWLIGNIEAAV
jgi:hypothetical protein